MFNKILIANRGEIALRVICACRELGIKTVAVYSEADEHSLHVRFADEDVCIGPARSLDSYLNVPAIISAAEITGADAIHPGLRLPVRERLPRRSLRGVPHQVHRAVSERHPADGRQGAGAAGDEEGRRAGAARAATGRSRAKSRRSKVAKELGYPVIIKAVAGGGGRGMRVVRNADELPKSFKTAMREAEAAFGVGDVYLEKYVESPRHIEIQVLGDHHGNVVHLGERECSIQRRHQKLIEEAPSVALTEKQRRRLGSDRRRCRARGAVHERRHVRVPDGPERPFLLPRGQHPPPGRASRHRVRHRHRHRQGTDPYRGRPAARRSSRATSSSAATRSSAASTPRIPMTFVPSPGVIHAFSVPGGPGVRVDTFAHSECTVSPYYDSLIAKIITLRPRPRRGDRAHAAHARDDGRRRHQDVDPAAPEDPGRPRFHRRPAQHELHGAVHAVEKRQEHCRSPTSSPESAWIRASLPRLLAGHSSPLRHSRCRRRGPAA